MSAHDTLDDDLQHPPPSAQRAAWPADVRRGGTTGRRPIARRQRDVHQPMVASNAAETSSTLSTWSENDLVVIDSIPNTCTVVACTTPDGCMPLHHNTMPAATGTSRHHNALRQPALPAASPRFFDAWNSSSTGHQRAENRLSGSTSWRQSRNQKLGEQYKGGLTGGKRVSDSVGAGSDHRGKDGRKANSGWERGAKAQKSLVEFWGGSNNKVVTSDKPDIPRNPDEEDAPAQEVTKDMKLQTDAETSIHPSSERPKPIFEGLCFFINGSTAPLVSDHRLKHLLSSHGGSHSCSLARRTVTHCILGASCGGGLSASKMQKEIAKTKRKGLRFVTADWVLSSIKANRRLPEINFSVQPTSKTQSNMISASKPTFN